VVDLTDLRGALCARMLADLGADVLRLVPVDPTDPVDVYRNANKRVLTGGSDGERPGSGGSSGGSGGSSGGFGGSSGGSGGSSGGPGGSSGGSGGRLRAESLQELVAGADVLVDNLPPQARLELGLEPAEVSAAFPRLVHVVMADFGLRGPRAGWRAEPLVAQAAGGTLFASGFRDLPPCWFPGYLGPDCASVYGLIGAVAALADRRRHGRGQTVEVSVQEATLAGTNPWSVAMKDYLRVVPYLPAEGRRNADGFYLVLPAADGWVRFVVGNDKQWRGAVALAGDPEALSGPEWLDSVYRRMNLDVIRLVLAGALSDRTRAELFEQARSLGATMGVIHQPREYVVHPQPAVRGVFAPGSWPGFEGAPVVRPPLEFSLTPGRREVAAPAPVVGPPWPEPAEPVAFAADHSPRGDLGRPQPAPADAALLQGIRVVEFGMAAVGPEASLILAEFGADVIKIESRRHLDVLRLAGGERVNCAFAFNVECRGRRSVCLDLSTAEGRRLAFELCARADVVIENYRGGVLDGLGLGYEAVAAANPAVVYASSQGYGRTGPLGKMAAYGPLNLGFAGLHLLWNHPDAPYPCGTSLNHPDHVAGKFLAAGVLAALAHRAVTGRGQRVDLAQTEFAAYTRGEVYVDSWLRGADPAPAGNSSVTACPHGVYPAAGDDQWVAVVAADDGDWERLCRVVGWGPDPGLAQLAGRLARAAEIDARLSAWTAGRPAEETADLLQAAGVSACPVMGPYDHLDDPHLRERGFIVELRHPEVGPERHAGNPLRMSVTRPRVLPSAPCLGEHTTEVLGEVLGIPPDEVAQLVDAGVCV
jgi:crotonobetainyl-CoA:carnitine CoA-transferase CaiB-like acyl-CoA transferase